MSTHHHSSSSRPMSDRVQRLVETFKSLGVVRLLYSHNPFYVASAWLVFSGLRMSFDTGGGGFRTTALTAGLFAYTLLLSATAYVLIRWGKVWDDARSLLLLVVLMFLGISVTFDGRLAADPATGHRYYLGGLLFAVAVSEGLLHLLRLRLPFWFRLTYHLLLALFFLYPISLKPHLTDPANPILHWQLAGFAPLAACVLLLLLPAVRRGPAYVEPNGSPWRWPAFPWVLFGLLGFCVCLRAYYLCLSLHFLGRSESIFGFYFLVPLILAAGLLLMESGIATGSRRASRLALAAPLVMLGAAAFGHVRHGVYEQFLDMFQSTLGGSPLYLTVVMIVAYYGLATMRRVRGAADALTASLVLLSLVRPTTVAMPALEMPLAWPLAVAAGIQSWMGWRKEMPLRVLGGAAGLLAGATIGWSDSWFAAYHAALPLHLLLFAMLAIGWRYETRTGLGVRWTGAVLLLMFAAQAMFPTAALAHEVPALVLALYPLLLVALAGGYAYWVGDRIFYIVAALVSALWMTAQAWRGYHELRPQLGGLSQMVWGALLFIVAALISLLKARAPERWRSHSAAKSADTEPI